jgi:hypothetical protein
MASLYKTLSANSSAEEHLLTISKAEKGFSIHIPATQSDGSTSNTLDGGTLQLKHKPSPESDYVVLDTLAVGDMLSYEVGSETDVALYLTGAGSPSVQVKASSYR